jgi:PIN domain nuclease of toxin-antitoxin system
VHNGEGKIIVPIIVFVEIIFIVEKKKVDLDVEEIIERICSNPNYIIKPFDFEQLSCIKRRTNISEMHDRIIVCEAITSNAKIITKDKKIQESGIVEVIW